MKYNTPIDVYNDSVITEMLNDYNTVDKVNSKIIKMFSITKLGIK